MYNQIVTTSKDKNILLPFSGLYQSVLGTELDSTIENEIYNNGIEIDNTEEVSRLIYDNLNSKAFNRKLCSLYAETLAEVINYEYDINIHFSSVDYIGLNGQNVGDSLECIINVDCLPSIKDISELFQLSVDEVWQQLQILSNTQFSSYSGFISFYDKDLTPLYNAEYINWDEGYIMLIIQLLLNETGKTISDIEQQTIENINSNYAGFIDMAYAFIKNDSVIIKLNKLLNY